MKLKVLFFALLLSVFYSCSDIFEHNLSKDAVEIYSPGNNARSANYAQQFWWKAVDHSTLYRLQITSPAFDTISTFILDSVTTKNKLIYSLKPGKYQWRVRAENASSYTPYTTFSLQIDTGDVASQTVTLLTPSEGSFSSIASQKFTWQEVFGASTYNVTIDSSGVKILDSIIHAPQAFMNFTFKKDNSYNWSVRAGKNSLYSPFTSRTFTLDSHAPDTVTMPLTPPSQITGTTHLSWGAPNATDVVSYRVFIYKIDPYTNFYPSPFYKEATSTNFDFQGGTIGTKYYWTVVPVDQAGNLGIPASKKSFIFK